MAKLERVYNIPLRKEWLKVSPIKRSKKATTAVKEFLTRHMKSNNVKLGKHLNENIWARGIKKPPHHIKVTAIKDDEGIVRAELHGFKMEEPKKEEKKGRLEELKERVTGKQANKPIAKETKKTTNESEAGKPVLKEKKHSQLEMKANAETKREEAKTAVAETKKQDKPAEQPKEPKPQQKEVK
jgi:large subunit ribosomal protein L31e